MDSLVVASRAPQLYEVGILLLPSSERTALVGSGKLSRTGNEVVKLLRASGFRVVVQDSQYKNKFLVALLYLNKSAFKRYATELGLPIRANGRALTELLIGYRSDRDPGSEHQFLDESMSNFLGVYLPYDENLDSRYGLYSKGEVPGGVGALMECNRQIIAADVLENHLNMGMLRGGGVVIDCFPLHNEKKQIKLWYYYSTMSHWFASPFTDMHNTAQIRALKDYVGKSVALFVIFGQHLAYLHLPLLVSGIIYALFSDNSGLTTGRSILGLSAPLLGMMSLRLWERKEAQIASDWGCHSPAALALSLPVSHSPFIREHTSGVDTVVDLYDLPPASTLPLKASGRSWWTDRVSPTFLTSETSASDSTDLTNELLWPVSLKHTLVMPTSWRAYLLPLRSILTTVTIVIITLALQLPVLIVVREVVSSLTRGMVNTDGLTFFMPLLVLASASTAISGMAGTLLHSVTLSEGWRTYRQSARAHLTRELLFKVAVWAGPVIWSLLQKYIEGSCKSHDHSCASAAGATATTMLLLHSTSEIILHFALPALRIRTREDTLKLQALKLGEHGGHSVLNTSSSAGVDHSLHPDRDPWGGGAMAEELEAGRRGGGPINNAKEAATAAAAEREFLTLSSAFLPDRDLDGMSHLSATYPQLLGMVVRWTITWTFFGLAPWTLFITSMHSLLDVFLVAYQNVFNHRRSFCPPTQLLAINPEALRVMRVLAGVAALAAASIFLLYNDGDHGYGMIVLLFTPSSSSSSSRMLPFAHTGTVIYFLYSWLVVLLLIIIDVTLPVASDKVILSSLRNEHLWRGVQSRLFFQAEGVKAGPTVYPAHPGSFRGHAGADGGDRQLRPDFRLRTLTTPQGTPIVARREDDFGRPIRGGTPGTLGSRSGVAEALVAKRAGEVERECGGDYEIGGEEDQGAEEEAGQVSPSSMDTEASFGKQAGKLAEWRKSSTVYEELHESDSDEA